MVHYLPEWAIFLQITELSLSNMPLVAGIENLHPGLETLYLANCGITYSLDLPRALSRLALKRLFLDRNPIGWWDDRTELPALECLSLSHCELRSIPLIESAFGSLVEINLSNNVLDIFCDLQQYPRLQSINLSHNKIAFAMELQERSQPPEPGDTRYFGPMRHLTDLDLSHNPLDELILRYPCNVSEPVFTKSYPALGRLKLSGNKMLPLPEDELTVLYGEPPVRIEPSTYWRDYPPICDWSLPKGGRRHETLTWPDGTKSRVMYFNL